MQFIVALLRKLPWVMIGGLFAAFLIGLVLGWFTVRFDNADASYLRPDLQEDYLRMAIDSYRVNQNPDLAVQRWKNLGPDAAAAYTAVQNNPGTADPAVVRAYGELVQSIIVAEQGTGGTEDQTSSVWRYAIYGFGLVALGLILAAALIFGRRFLGTRGTGEPTPVMQAAEISRQTEKTNYENLGLAAPITQTMTTYVLGDDLYDESFSIDTPAGEFLGEYGVGVSEAIGVGDPKKVTALEIWLFDKNDIKTATKVLMTEHAFQDAGIRSRLEPKGELVLSEPQGQILLETATLQLLATVVDLEYGRGPMPQNSYFERITLELAIWPRGS